MPFIQRWSIIYLSHTGSFLSTVLFPPTPFSFGADSSHPTMCEGNCYCALVKNHFPSRTPGSLQLKKKKRMALELLMALWCMPQKIEYWPYPRLRDQRWEPMSFLEWPRNLIRANGLPKRACTRCFVKIVWHCKPSSTDPILQETA